MRPVLLRFGRLRRFLHDDRRRSRVHRWVRVRRVDRENLPLPLAVDIQNDDHGQHEKQRQAKQDSETDENRLGDVGGQSRCLLQIPASQFNRPVNERQRLVDGELRDGRARARVDRALLRGSFVVRPESTSMAAEICRRSNNGLPRRVHSDVFQFPCWSTLDKNQLARRLPLTIACSRRVLRAGHSAIN